MEKSHLDIIEEVLEANLKMIENIKTLSDEERMNIFYMVVINLHETTSKILRYIEPARS